MVVLTTEQQRMIENLYRQAYRKLLVYARSGLRNLSIAEEAVQDTFKIACVKVDDLETCPNPHGWLMSTLKFVMRNIQKKQKHTNALFSDRELDESITVSPPDIRVETAVTCEEVLGQTDYLLLKRVTLKEATIRDAAQEFGLSEAACSKRIQRSKKKLQNTFRTDEI